MRATKKLLVLLSTVVAANAFAYNVTINNNAAYTSGSSSGKIVLRAGGVDIQLQAGSHSYELGDATNYDMMIIDPSGASFQKLASLQKNSSQYTIGATIPEYASAYQNVKVEYLSSGNGATYSGSYQALGNQGGGLSYAGSCKQDGGNGVTCPMSSGQSVSSATITLSGGTPAPEPKPADPTPISSPSGLYYSNAGVWNSTTSYTPYWNNDINGGEGASVYPVVQDNGQDYIACYAITASTLAPHTAADGTVMDSNGQPIWNNPWKAWDKNNSNVCK